MCTLSVCSSEAADRSCDSCRSFSMSSCFNCAFSSRDCASLSDAARSSCASAAALPASAVVVRAKNVLTCSLSCAFARSRLCTLACKLGGAARRRVEIFCVDRSGEGLETDWGGGLDAEHLTPLPANLSANVRLPLCFPPIAQGSRAPVSSSAPRSPSPPQLRLQHP